jgi:hypothetical protein
MSDKFYGWVIDRDYLPMEGLPSRVGYGMKPEQGALTNTSFDHVIGATVYVDTALKASDVIDPVRFRALDDDGEVYYGGAVSRQLVEESDEAEFSAYDIDRFVMADAGATQTQFRAKDLSERFVEIHRNCNCVIKASGEEWVIVYG